MFRSLLLLGLLTGLQFACSEDTPTSDADNAGADGGVDLADGGGTLDRPMARFVVDADRYATAFAHVPFPSDLYLTPEGTVRLDGFPYQLQGSMVDVLVTALSQETKGFGTSSGLYLSFESPINEEALPTNGASSIRSSSTLFLVNIDPDSPSRGEKVPITWRVFPEETQYLPSNSLGVRLVEGATLMPATQYALVVTTDAATAPESFLATLGETRPEGAVGAAWDVHAGLRTWLGENDISVAVAGVFTTQDPVSEMFTLRDYMHTLPRPAIDAVESTGIRQNLFEVFQGTYQAPRFQEGEVPYTALESGGIRFDEQGEPIIQGEETIRFALSVPIEGEMPANGWPVVLYGHGTGGNFLSFLNSRTAVTMAHAGFAVLSIDQIHHGTRDPRPNGCQTAADPGACVGLLFFNFLVPLAGRDNVRQSALDFVSLTRLAQDFSIAADVSERAAPVRLDPANISYMGHSQGGVNGPLFVAIEEDIKGAVFSAAGASIAISIEQKTLPLDINMLVQTFLTLGPNDVLDRWHPTLMLVQTFIESGDPVNYARYWFHDVPDGRTPKSIFMTAGLADEYTPPDSILALAAAGRVPIIEPVAQRIPLHDIYGIDPAGIPPYAGNVAGGTAAAGIAQFEGQGHFVARDSVSVRGRYRQFLESLLRGEPQIY